MNLSIIIPLYNEAAGVAYLKARLRMPLNVMERQHNLELILVDDGSTDDTHRLLVEHFAEYSAKIIRHERNLGLGAALRTGIRAATGDYLCTMDSDCTYDPAQFMTMLTALITSGADIITGSPYHPQGAVKNVKFWRLFISQGLSRLYSLVLPYGLHTYTSFFRIYRRRVAEAIDFRSDGFLAVTEILVLAILSGYQVIEFPTTLRVRRYGRSKIKTVHVMLSHLKFLARIIGRQVEVRAPERKVLMGAGTKRLHQ